MITKFRCSICGKITSGRIPKHGRDGRDGRERGDLTVRYPRRHRSSNPNDNISAYSICRGSILPAEWVDVAEK